jgi:hypothetical protein
MPSLAFIAAITISTRATIPMMNISGNVSTAPMNSVSTVRIHRIRKIAEMVMLKFSASLAWSSTKGIVSFLTSQITSGPMNEPQPPNAPVNSAPAIADRCANIAHCRCSALGASEGGGGAGAGGGVIASLGSDIGIPLGDGAGCARLR